MVAGVVVSAIMPRKKTEPAAPRKPQKRYPSAGPLRPRFTMELDRDQQNAWREAAAKKFPGRERGVALWARPILDEAAEGLLQDLEQVLGGFVEGRPVDPAKAKKVLERLRRVK